ncbi:hypothetical protein M8C21_029866 [Ambrosia artemisiifolia]|uniref:Uncharacterized protein n=1 Tax=Ambrosia artemisiifolia TaxID=4212 RepID=A0AAD5GKR4_AMBAR|nr:hypothetical protein M8C21_029866 [Ambrosia artemisiifolia]
MVLELLTEKPALVKKVKEVVQVEDEDSRALRSLEVDRFKDLSKMLHKDGFKGVYQARTGEACDGCAIFWKDELNETIAILISLLHEDNIEFKRFGLRDNVAQFCVLKCRGCPKAYHPACIRRDEEFFESATKWNCDSDVDLQLRGLYADSSDGWCAYKPTALGQKGMDAKKHAYYVMRSD